MRIKEKLNLINYYKCRILNKRKNINNKLKTYSTKLKYKPNKNSNYKKIYKTYSNKNNKNISKKTKKIKS